MGRAVWGNSDGHIDVRCSCWSWLSILYVLDMRCDETEDINKWEIRKRRRIKKHNNVKDCGKEVKKEKRKNSKDSDISLSIISPALVPN